MDLSTIGSAIRAARKTQGRSQAVLAHSLGMSRATISAIENGSVSEIGVRKLMALCAALGLTVIVTQERKRPTLQELRDERRSAKAGG